MDFLSLLPDHLLPSILSLLPIHEAVRTSVLARRYRRLWTHITDITIAADHLSPDNITKHIRYVDSILTCTQLNIRRFRIAHIRLSARWADRLVGLRIRELGLTNTGPNYLLGSQSLAVLKLQLCKLDYIDGCYIASCTNIKSLELESVTVSVTVIREVLSKLQRLETLELKYCNLYAVVIHHPRLERLIVRTGVSRLYVDIEAPNLREMELDVMCNVKRIRVFVPEVRKCGIWFQGGGLARGDGAIGRELRGVLAGIGNADELRLGGAVLQCLSMCISSWEFATEFQNLKKLCATLCTSNPTQTSVLIALLRTCSQLQELRLEVNNMSEKEEDRLHCTVSSTNEFDCPIRHLQRAEIIGFTGNSYEVEMVKFLIAKARVVEFPGKWLEVQETAGRGAAYEVLEEISRQYVTEEGGNSFSVDVGESRIRIIAI